MRSSTSTSTSPRGDAAVRRRPGAALLLALLAAVCAATGLLAPPPVAHAADNGQWSVFPATGEDAPARAHFEHTAEAGTTVRDRVTIANLADTERTFALYGADAYNTPRDGGFAVRAADEEQRAVGAWLRLDREEVTVPAGERVTVPFTLTIPRNAEPGDHPGAVVALDQRVLEARGRVGMGVRQAVGARVYLEVTGERAPSLRVEDVRWVYDAPLVPGTGERPATIEYTLVNDGNVTLSPRVALTADGLFGDAPVAHGTRRAPAELLPGERVALSEEWAGPPVLDRGDVRVEVTDPRTGVHATGSAPFLLVPWLLLAVFALALAALAAHLVRRRRAARAAHPA
ncbi:DUF916 domain-containing protein [Streptomyces sp. TRM70308]|uniref:COG1470 family protein n=1 Tax=Streptomyces sp. TRM70308 TaxID=3131932 RepID=UPI003D040FDE